MMGEQLGTGRTPETFPEELPPLQEENSQITNLNNDMSAEISQEGRRGKWSIFRARGTLGEKSLGPVRRKAGGICSWSNISCLQEIQGSVENKLSLKIKQQPPGTLENLPDTTAP